MKKTAIFSVALASLAPASAMAQDSGNSFAFMIEGPNMALSLMALVQIIAIIAAAGVLRRLTSNASAFTKLRKLAESQEVKAVIVALICFGSAGSLMAQGAEVPKYPEFLRDDNTILLIALNVLLLFVFLYIISTIRGVIGMLMPPAEKAPTVAEESEEVGAGIMAALTDAVPVEQEHEILMDHEYDGIRELDNNLPPWWVWMFYVTIIFSVVYMAWYHVLPYSKDQHEEYVAELLQAEEEKAAYIAMRGEMVDETNVEFLEDAADLKVGRKIFMEHCQACHAADGGGGVGPNLTDEYWIHGGSMKEVFSVVKYGVPTKGMVAWSNILRPKEMAQVSSYILSLQGTTPAAPKEPQGEKYVPEADPEAASEGEQDTESEEKDSDPQDEESNGDREEIEDTEESNVATAAME